MAERGRRSVWTALTVPTFKMRIGQTFVVVLCIVAALIAVGAVVLVKSSDARKKAEGAAVLYRVSDRLEEAERDSEAVSAVTLAGRPDQVRALLPALKAKLKQAGDDATRVGGDGPVVLGRAVMAARSAVVSANTAATLGRLSAKAKAEADRLLAEAVSEGRGTVTFGVTAYAILLVVTGIAGMVTMTAAYRGISGVVKKVIDEVRAIASGKGDLTARVNVPTPDVYGDLADAINDMVSSLHGSTLEMRAIAVQLSSSADTLAESIEGMSGSIEEVSAAAEQISTGSEDQARKVEETSTAVGEVSRSVDEIAQKAGESSSKSATTAEISVKGADAAEEAARTMREIYESVKTSEGLMKGLGERFTQIGIIIDVITDIADQTNLLALNAAIEAARAGEHGKGFAVVAGQVRDLAENSKRSAEQISHLIREIVAETNRVATSMEEGTGRVEAGRLVAERTGEALWGITDSSRAAAGAAEEISNSIHTIAANIDQVFGAVNDIAAIAEETAASTEEVAATLSEQRVATGDVAQASIELARLASKLHELTDGFKL